MKVGVVLVLVGTVLYCTRVLEGCICKHIHFFSLLYCRNVGTPTPYFTPFFPTARRPLENPLEHNLLKLYRTCI